LDHDPGAHLLEYASGEEVAALVRRGEDEAAAMIISEVLNRLHETRSAPLPEGLRKLRRWFRALFDKAASEPQDTPSIYRRAVAVAEDLLATEQDCCVLHGDIHHANIRHHSQRGWLAFDPKGLYGERTYDTANTLYNALYVPDTIDNEALLLKVAGILATGTGIDLKRMLQFAFVYGCLSAAWSLEASEDPYAIQALRIAAIVEKHL
jgi:streptomycin 6-kinase